MAAAKRSCRLSSLLAFVVSAASTPGCDRNGNDESAKAVAPVGIPVDAGTVTSTVNPAGAPVHTGPAATVFGTITVAGDEATLRPELSSKIPKECAAARDFYAPVFREGKGRTLADVLVTVTGYKGYVPARDLKVRIEAKDCTWGARTLAVTYGQRIEVTNHSKRTYIPKLFGSSQSAMLVAVPDGDPVAIYPTDPGHYVLMDAGFNFMQADVFALKYSTFDVTDAGGKYSIGRIPPGEVTVTAFLPATMQKAERRVTLQGNTSKRVDLQLKFDAAAHAARESKAERLQKPRKRVDTP